VVYHNYEKMPFYSISVSYVWCFEFCLLWDQALAPLSCAIDEKEVSYPFVEGANVLMINTQSAYDKSVNGTGKSLEAHRDLFSQNKVIVDYFTFEDIFEIKEVIEHDNNGNNFYHHRFPQLQSDLLDDFFYDLLKKRGKIDAVFLYTTGAPLEGRIIQCCEDNKIPVIVHHSWDMTKYKINDILTAVDNHVVVSKDSVTALKLGGCKNVTYLPPKVHDSFYDYSKLFEEKITKKIDVLKERYPDLKKNVFKILAPSRLDEKKGVFDLIEIANYLKKDHLDFQVIYLKQDDSNDILIEQMKKKIEEFGLQSNILFIDNFKASEDDMIALYQLSDMSVLPTQDEAFGLVVVESMSQKRPVVAYDAGGVSTALGHSQDLIDFSTKMFISSFAEAIIKLMNDKEYYLKKSLDAWHYSLQYRPSEIRHLYLSFFNNMLQRVKETSISKEVIPYMQSRKAA